MLEPSHRKGSTKRCYHNMNVECSNLLPTPTDYEKTESHYIYLKFKKISKVPHIIGHFKNYTISTKNHLTNSVLAIKRRTRFVTCVCVRLFTKSGNSALSWWLTLTCASMSIADGWLRSTCVYSYAQSHVLFLVLMVCMLLSLFLLL